MCWKRQGWFQRVQKILTTQFLAFYKYKVWENYEKINIKYNLRRQTKCTSILSAQVSAMPVYSNSLWWFCVIARVYVCVIKLVSFQNVVAKMYEF